MKITKEKRKTKMLRFYLLILFVIFGLNSKQIQGHQGEEKHKNQKYFTHENPEIAKCIREYPDKSENQNDETTMQILKNIVNGVIVEKFGRETWDYLAQFFGPESQWRRAELFLFYCQKRQVPTENTEKDLNKCLNTVFHPKNGHLANLEKITPNYEKSVALFESLIIEKELSLARKLNKYLRAKEINLEMIFDILLGRTRWELHRIIMHYKKEKFTDLLTNLSDQARKESTKEFAYTFLARLVFRADQMIHDDEQVIDIKINKVFKILSQFCTTGASNKYDEFFEKIDNLLEIIDFGSPKAIEFGERFEKLCSKLFFDFNVKEPRGTREWLFYEMRKTMLIMSGLAGKEKYLENQLKRWTKMNLDGNYDGLSTFLTIHFGQDMGKIFEHYKKEVIHGNTIEEIEKQFGSEIEIMDSPKKIYGIDDEIEEQFERVEIAESLKFDAYISLMKVVNGRKVENTKRLFEPGTSIQPQPQNDSNCYGESETEYEKEREIGLLAYEQLKFSKLENLELKLHNKFPELESKIEQYNKKKFKCKTEEIGLFRKKLYKTSIYDNSYYGIILNQYLNKEEEWSEYSANRKNNLLDDGFCLWKMIKEEKEQFCARLEKHKNGLMMEIGKIIDELKTKMNKKIDEWKKKYEKKINKDEINEYEKRMKKKLEVQKQIRTRFLKHLLVKIEEMKQNCKCSTKESPENLYIINKEITAVMESDNSSYSSASSSSLIDENVQPPKNKRRVKFTDEKNTEITDDQNASGKENKKNHSKKNKSEKGSGSGLKNWVIKKLTTHSSRKNKSEKGSGLKNWVVKKLTEP